ncbi:MAG: SRPBCC family protein [Candidatus Doudnabacteria bacterium]
MPEYQIVWPEGFDPGKYPVHSYNQLFIPASAEDIWRVLTDAAAWPLWYPNAKDVKILEGQQTLNQNTKFTWRTFGLHVISEVLIFQPFTDLGWNARGFASRGFHGWKIIPQAQGCMLVTEEVQGGLGPSLLSRLVEKNLVKQHQKWLEGIITRVRPGL